MNNSLKKLKSFNIVYNVENEPCFLQVSKFLEQKKDDINLVRIRNELTNHIPKLNFFKKRNAVVGFLPFTFIPISIITIMGLVIWIFHPYLITQFESVLIMNLEDFSLFDFTVGVGIVVLIIVQTIHIHFKKLNNLKLKSLQNEVITCKKQIRELRKNTLTDRQINIIKHMSEYLENLENLEAVELKKDDTKKILYTIIQSFNKINKQYAKLTNTDYDDMQKLSDEDLEELK